MGFSKLREEDFYSDESKFVLGIDLGNCSTCVSYYDFNIKKTQLLDISGGYSRASIPTVVQYAAENDEWIFGEYALLNRPIGEEITFKDIIKNMGKNLSFEIGERKISLCYVLSLFIMEITKEIKSINPNAQICAAAVSAAAYLSDEAKLEIELAFEMAGYKDIFMGFIDERECVLNLHFAEEGYRDEKILLLDYAEGGLRGNAFETEKKENGFAADCILSLEDRQSAAKQSEKELTKLFRKYFMNHLGRDELSEEEEKEIEIFSYEHFDLFLQREIKNEIKLYYTFCYPPLKVKVRKETVQEFLEPYIERFEEFLEAFKDYDCYVITSGGGFDRVFAKKAVIEAFGRDNVYFRSKSAAAQGACIALCIKTGLLNSFEAVEIQDRQRIVDEIGVFSENMGFVSLSEKNSFWWQEQKKRVFIIDNSTDNDPLLKIYRKSRTKTVSIGEIRLDELVCAKNKVKKISLELRYEDRDTAFIDIADIGFGEIEESTGFNGSFRINIR